MWSEIIRKAEEYAISEMDVYHVPSNFLPFFITANEMGEKIATKLNADMNIVRVGTRLMDIKLPEAFSQNKLGEHVKMSSAASKEFLKKFKITEEEKKKIINCVEGHHGTIKWKCKEAEICANADCYKFLSVKGFLIFVHSLGERGSFKDALKYAEEKVDEKWKILSLPMCKKDLAPQYKLIKEIISFAKK